jgi:hypothetical protein
MFTPTFLITSGWYLAAIIDAAGTYLFDFIYL